MLFNISVRGGGGGGGGTKGHKLNVSAKFTRKEDLNLILSAKGVVFIVGI